MTKLKKCIHCGWEAHVDSGLDTTEWRIECSNVNGCRAWIRIYSIFKKYAVSAWNKANTGEEEDIKPSSRKWKMDI